MTRSSSVIPHRNSPAPFVARRRTRRAINILVTVLVVTSMLLSPFAGIPIQPANVAVAQPQNGTPLPPPGPRPTATPLVNPRLPSLTLQVGVSAQAVSIGDILTVTLRIENQAPDPANNLEVRMPIPAGVTGLPDPGPAGWRWQSTQLGGGATISHTARLLITQVPTGDAIVARAEATAQGLPFPTTAQSGAVVVQRVAPPGTARYNPGTAALLRSSDNRVEVQVPRSAANRALNLRHDVRPRPGRPAAPPVVGFKRGFPAFYLDAIDDQGGEVHQFAEPLTITVSYTPQQLEALNLSEQDLSIFWLDDSLPIGRQWVPLTTKVDTRNHVATALVDHFSTFALGEDFRPSDAFIPSLKEWQVGLFEGSVNYGYDIEVPAGAGGHKPSLTLRYDSTATDGAGGMKKDRQSTWAGKGWSLDTGYIATNRLNLDRADMQFSMVLNGQSFELMQDQGVWRTTNETFVKIVRVDTVPSDETRGGFHFGEPYMRSKWVVWTKDGTRYEFEEDAWWGWMDDPKQCGYAFMETYKWYLSKVADTNNNEILYTYDRQSVYQPDQCFHVTGTIDKSVWPVRITWNQNRYKVEFTSFPRTMDTEFDAPENQYGPTPRETQKLKQIAVYSNVGPVGGAEDWRLVRRYDLIHDEANPMLSDWYGNCDANGWNCQRDVNYRKLSKCSDLRWSNFHDML